jgi:hypothetical protein
MQVTRLIIDNKQKNGPKSDKLLVKPLAQFKKTKSNRNLLSSVSGAKNIGKKGLLFPIVPEIDHPCKSAFIQSTHDVDSVSDGSDCDIKKEENKKLAKVRLSNREKFGGNIEVNLFVNFDGDSEDSSPIMTKNMKPSLFLDLKKCQSDNTGKLGVNQIEYQIPIITMVPLSDDGRPITNN